MHIPIIDQHGNCVGYVPQADSNVSRVEEDSPLHQRLAMTRKAQDNPAPTPDTSKRKENVWKRQRRLGRL